MLDNFFISDTTIFFVEILKKMLNKSCKKSTRKAKRNSKLFFVYRAETAQRDKFMFQNVAYV